MLRQRSTNAAPSLKTASGCLLGVFDRYYRGSNVWEITGAGVGLIFVKMVVDMHHGTVKTERRDGSGSRITVRLPIQPRLQGR